MKNKTRLFILLAGILILSGAFWWCLRPTEKVLHTPSFQGLQRLQRETYDTIFLSTFPVTEYQEEDYSRFRGMTMVKNDMCMVTEKILRRHLQAAFSSGNEIHTAYLGVQPDKLSPEILGDILETYPETSFEIILSYPQMSYWTHMEDMECEDMIACYYDLASSMLSYENARVYLFSGTEWLICNPANYAGTFHTNKEISRTLMLNTDDSHGFMLSTEQLDATFTTMSELIYSYKEAPIQYPDASNWDIVFLGDSIIGNFTDSSSVPGVVRGLTGANVYNCGYGGRGAARNEHTPIALPDVVNCITAGDASPLPVEEQVYKGVNAFLERETTAPNLMFVINHGLNDYFTGVPVETADSYDITSYSGALRTAIRDLQTHFPGAEILLNTSNFTTFFDNGKEINSHRGGQLIDYVNAVPMVARDMNVNVLDVYHLLPITDENWQLYLSDGCHPNEMTRFYLGSFIAELVE